MDSLEEALPETVRSINSGIERGWQTGLQLYVSLRGEVVADAGAGEVAPREEMTPETVMPLLSAGKPLTAAAIMQLVEAGDLHLEGCVSEWIPEFGTHGKEDIRLHHLLTHTAGVRHVDTGWPELAWERTLQRICDTPLEDGWRIGETAGYRVSSSWFILGELIQRADPKARDFPAYLREEIADPLGMQNTWNGMPEEVYLELKGRIGRMSQRERGTVSTLPWHEAGYCIAPSPGGNTRGPVRELGKFYECLLAGGELEGQRILDEDSVELMTSRHREGQYDRTLQHTVDFGLGVIIDSKRYGEESVPYGYSGFCSEETFGHAGSQSSIGFADPEAELVVCYAANCRIGEGRHQKRNGELVSAIYRDLGLPS